MADDDGAGVFEGLTQGRAKTQCSDAECCAADYFISEAADVVLSTAHAPWDIVARRMD